MRWTFARPDQSLGILPQLLNGLLCATPLQFRATLAEGDLEDLLESLQVVVESLLAEEGPETHPVDRQTLQVAAVQASWVREKDRQDLESHQAAEDQKEVHHSCLHS